MMAACTATDYHAQDVRSDVRSRRPGSGHLSLRSVNHISKVCSSVAASVAFYRDVLGFMLVKRPQSFEDSFEGCWMWRYGLGLHLIKGQPVPRESRIDPKSDHLSFQADSLDDVEEQLVRRSIPYVRQKVVEGGLEVQQLFFHDPDNNMIEVCNCDCLPIIPIDLARCATCADEAEVMGGKHLAGLLPSPHQACNHSAHEHEHPPAHPHLPHLVSPLRAQQQHAQQANSDDEVMSDSRDSLDSNFSEQCRGLFASAASALAATPPPESGM